LDIEDPENVPQTITDDLPLLNEGERQAWQIHQSKPPSSSLQQSNVYTVMQEPSGSVYVWR
jgi:hypothetical protein